MERYKKAIIVDLDLSNESSHFTSSISSATIQAQNELEIIHETVESLKLLEPDKDKVYYALAASPGALCGIIDIFLVGKPGESPLGNITDQWFADRTIGFAKLCGWKPQGEPTLKKAIASLQNKFKIPYDQTSIGEAAKEVLGLDTSTFTHHFQSLGHNPSLLGLFFSILDQFAHSSHFVLTNDEMGMLFSLEDVGGEIQLYGKNVPAKLFAAFKNWFGHIMSDISGSSASVGRGTGVPSPLWTWINDVIVIKNKLNIPVSDFDRDFTNLAVELFKEGYDMRFQTAQGIPVLLNEMLVRLIYALRRLLKYYQENKKENRTFKDSWNYCKPFGNPTVKRMLTIAHGTFCIIDVGEATFRGIATGGGYFNPVEFCLRLNLVGVGRFTISLYGEAKDGLIYYHAKQDSIFAQREKLIVEDYIKGLKELARLYDDSELLQFTDRLKESVQVKTAFDMSAELVKQRGGNPLNTMEDIVSYFGKNNGK